MNKSPGPFRKFVETYPECGMTYEALPRASREAAGFAEKEAERRSWRSRWCRVEEPADCTPGAPRRARRRPRCAGSRFSG